MVPVLPPLVVQLVRRLPGPVQFRLRRVALFDQAVPLGGDLGQFRVGGADLLLGLSLRVGGGRGTLLRQITGGAQLGLLVGLARAQLVEFVDRRTLFLGVDPKEGCLLYTSPSPRD